MFRCEECKSKDEQIRYLRTLVDRLLEKVDVAPVDPALPIGTQAFHEDGTMGEHETQDRVGI